MTFLSNLCYRIRRCIRDLELSPTKYDFLAIKVNPQDIPPNFLVWAFLDDGMYCVPHKGMSFTGAHVVQSALTGTLVVVSEVYYINPLLPYPSIEEN